MTGNHAVIAGLALWLVLSALNQVRPVGDRLARFDPFGLLPRWTFFAPNPGIHDHHLIFREAQPRTDDDPELSTEPVFGAWCQVEDTIGAATIPLLWNPGRRLHKTFTDIVNGFARMRRHAGDFDMISLFSTEYAWMTHMIEKRVGPRAVFQWAVVKTHGNVDRRNLSIVFVSRLHEGAA